MVLQNARHETLQLFLLCDGCYRQRGIWNISSLRAELKLSQLHSSVLGVAGSGPTFVLESNAPAVLRK